MRNVILWMQQSVDGFIEGPNGEFDWPIVREELHQYFIDQARALDTFLYGRRVYQLMANFWPTADADPSSTEQTVEFARIWKRMPKIVFSKTLDHAEWNTRVVSENIAEEITRLKGQPGKDMALFGGADIAATFMRLGLIDEYRLFVHPVVLGGGKRLFGRLDGRTNVQLVEARTFDPGVVLLRYRQAAGESHFAG